MVIRTDCEPRGRTGERKEPLKRSIEEIAGELTDEQKAKLKDLKSVDELIELAEKEGIKFSADELEAITGGGVNWVDRDS